VAFQSRIGAVANQGDNERRLESEFSLAPSKLGLFGPEADDEGLISTVTIRCCKILPQELADGYDESDETPLVPVRGSVLGCAFQRSVRTVSATLSAILKIKSNP